MSASAILIIIVATRAAGEDQATMTRSMIRAASEAIGLSADVSVREGSMSDDELIDLALREHAAVARLEWVDQQASRARVHFHTPRAGPFIDRSVVFDVDDAPTERGRALGFALASMMPEPTSTPSPSTTDRTDAVDLPSALANLEAEFSERVARPVVPIARVWHGALDFALSYVVLPQTLSSEFGTALGGGIGATLFVGRVGVRASSSVRVGSIAPAQATALYANAGLGLVVHVVEPHAGQHFGFGVRSDGLLVYQLATRGTFSVSRWVPGCDFVVFGTADLTSAFALTVGIGFDATFGTSTVFIDHTLVGQIGPVRALGEIGLVARF